MPKDASGHVIEDVASVQKSVASILIGIAQEKGLLRIDDTVTQYLGAGWSRAEPAQERAITIRHLNSPSTSRCSILGIVNLPMSWSIAVKTLPNTYPELAELGLAVS